MFVLIIVLSAVWAAHAQTHPEPREELLQMRERDRQARAQCRGSAEEQLKCLVATLEKVDRPNTARLSGIYKQSGFPTARMVGRDGVGAFLLMLQHSPDENLRRRSLKPVTKAFRRAEITPTARVNRNQAQLYGSNFEMKDGKLVMSAVKDRPNLNRRRKRLGLPTIEEYVAKLKELYNLEVVF